MRKIISYLMVLLVICSLLSTMVFATNTPAITMKVDNNSAKVEDTVEVKVSLENNPGIINMVLGIEYDETVIKLTKVEDAGILGSNVFSEELTQPYYLAWNNGTSKSNFEVDGVIATLTFKILSRPASGSTIIKVTYDNDNEEIIDKDLNTVDFETCQQTITVRGKDFSNDMKLSGVGEYGYDADAHKVKVANLPEGATVTWYQKNADGDYYTITEPSYTDAGTYYVKAEVSAAGYNTATLEGTLTITKADLSVDDITITKTYDGTKDVDTTDVEVNVTGVQGKDELSFQLDEITLDSDNAGTYTIDNATVTVEGKEEVLANYNLPETAKVTVVVEPKLVHIVINDATKVAGMDNYTLTWAPADGYAYTESELALISGSPAVTITKDEADKAYDITQGTLAIENTNYKLVVDKTGTLNIVAKAPKTVTVTGTMTKTEYWEGETLVPAGLTVVATFEGNITENVDLNSCVFTHSVMPEVNEDDQVTVTLSYLGKEADWSQPVTVKDNPIVSIEVDATNAKKIYKVSDELTKDGLVVTATYKNAEDNNAPKVSKELEESDYSLTATLANASENVVVTVTLDTAGDISGVYPITVIDKELTGLKIVDTEPSALSLIEGQTFNLRESGVKVYAIFGTYSEAAEKEKDVTTEFYNQAASITSDKADTVTEPLTYKYRYGLYEATASCNLTVTFASKSVTDIEVVKDPDKTAYYEGDSFDPTGAQIKLTYDNGKSDTITENFGNYGITFSPATLAKDTTAVTVSAGKYSDTISVTVTPLEVEKITIALKDSSKTYVDGESLSKDDIIVTVHYNNGSTKITTDFEVSITIFALENAATSATVPVTVTYGTETTFTGTIRVEVDPCVAIVDDVRYADLQDAIDAAKEGDTIELPLAGDYDVDVDKDLTFENTSGEDITLTINGEEETIEDGDSYEYEVPVEEDDKPDSTYFNFYLQMLQWRNRTFHISYKQTEGGTVSGDTSVRFSQSVTITVTPDEGYEIADVTVNGKSVGAVKTYTIKNIKANTTVSATFTKIETVETVEVEIVPEVTVWVNPFTDVKETDAFYAAVQYVYENGLFKGMSATEFAPDTTMTRAMFVTVLGRLTGVNVDDFTNVTFADCEADSWYAPYVEWAAQAGIVKGMSATEFAPYAEITVEQAVTILYRYMNVMGYDLSGADTLTAYADAESVNDWALEAMQWAVACDVYDVADTLAPQNAAARSLVAVMLYNLSGLLAK